MFVSTTPDAFPEEPEEWKADHYVLEFSSSKNAQTYYITLNPLDTAGISSQEYRIKEDALTGTVEVYVKDVDEGGNSIWTSVTADQGGNYILPGYQMDINGSYEKDGYVLNFYKTTVNTVLKAEYTEGSGFHYMLTVPDVIKLTAMGSDGSDVTIPDSVFKLTESINFQSDVNDNDAIDEKAERSDAYVGSDVTTIWTAN